MTSNVSAPTIREETVRRRSIAVISHPDAGKSTITEALALHAKVINEAGAVHGRGSRSGVVSDWLDIEKKRGISITSAALQFEYDGLVINLLDTPGHADFSEDTYRVLTAVDAAVMLIDSSKGLEPQTLKLFEVCRSRGVPVITFINKWDRLGKDALELCDELTERINLSPTPITWPVGRAGEMKGLLDLRDQSVTFYERAPGGATLALSETVTLDQALERFPDEVTEAMEASGLLGSHDPDTFHSLTTSPLLFGAALTNIGVAELLSVVKTIAPCPGPRELADGTPRPVDAPFSGFVFKMQAGMDKAHRDHLAFVRVCSGQFTRGMTVVQERTGRSFATKYALSVFGRDRSTMDIAFPGDVVGLVNASSLHVGDTIHATDSPGGSYPPMPHFNTEHFSTVRVKDPSKSKQFRKGIAQLEQEGVIQILVSENRGDASPILAAVGPLQFEVAAFRMEHEFHAPIIIDQLDYSIAKPASTSDIAMLAGALGVEITHRRDGSAVALIRDRWRLNALTNNHPTLFSES